MHARGGLLFRERWARRGRPRTAHAGQAHRMFARERKMTNKVESSTIAAFAMGMVTTSSGNSGSGSLPVEARVAPDPVTVAMGYYIERVVVSASWTVD
jgi:hypothetical protein